jgi:hypothetical protein
MSDADDLVAFVKRCLDEDERVAREGERYWHGIRIESATEVEEDHVRRWDPARVLAEVEAKRRILDLYEGACAEVRSFVTADQRAAARVAQFQLEAVITAFAQPYAGHEGWREEWQASAPA